MIAEVVRGDSMPDLISYLFGPGRYNEHENQHLVAGYADSVFSAPDQLWRSEPGVQRHVHREARGLGWEVDYPRSRWGTEVPGGSVWHCSMSIKAEEGQLTDAQWTEAAHAMVSALGFSGEDGKAPCRWVAVRHGLSANGNDHIHLAVNLVREDGTKASTWNDFRKAGAVCADLETRFGLQHVAGRTSGRHLSEPSRADREISAARREPEPLRIRLERTVRACTAAADSEARFIGLIRKHGLLIRPRYASGDRTRVVGYAVADRDGRQAYSTWTKTRGPIWFGGGKLATDLALPRLRERWGAETDVTDTEALAAWSVAATMAAEGPAPRVKSQRQVADADGDAGAAADLLAAVATSTEGRRPGPLSEAARHMARAAQENPSPRDMTVTEAVRGMADTFLSVTFAGESSAAGALILMQEVARLADTCAARAATVTAQREAQRASVLVRTSIEALTRKADTQAAATLTSTTKEPSMSEPTHEEETLRLVTQAGVLAAQLARARVGGRSGASSPGRQTDREVSRLRAAGYSENTPYDDLLRNLLGEQRWASYARDDARLAAAAAITDADRAGIYDMEMLLTKAVHRRAWETDPTSPARSVAEILHYRVTTEAERRHESVMVGSSPSSRSRSGPYRTDLRSTSSQPSPGKPVQAQPQPLKFVTPYDGKLRDLLGEERWQQYAADPKREAVATLLTQAAADGRDVDDVLTQAVTMREFEQDPVSPARRVAGVLHYRIESVLADKPEPEPRQGVPDGLSAVLSNAQAPTGSGPKTPVQPDQAHATPPPHQRYGRPSDGREGR